MKRLYGLDGVRACACLMIVLHHLVQQLPTTFSNDVLQLLQGVCLNALQSGVTVFFVLSGALLSRPFWKNYFSGKDLPSLKVFFVRRAARIMPVFYLALVISFVIERLFFSSAPNPLQRFFTAITFTSGFHYTTLYVTPINGPLWSISFEVISYVLLTVFMIGLFFAVRQHKAGKGAWYWVFSLGVVLLLNEEIQCYCQPDDIRRGWQYGSVGGAKYMMPGVNPVGFFAQYLFGVAASGVTVWLEHNTVLQGLLRQYGAFDIAAVIGIGLFAILLIVSSTWKEFDISLQGQPYHYPLLTGAAALAVAVLPLSRYAGRIMDNRFFTYTAKLSFGIYIWHYLAIDLVFHGMKRFGLEGTGVWIPGCILVLVSTYVMSALSWGCLEKPILNRAKTYTERWIG